MLEVCQKLVINHVCKDIIFNYRFHDFTNNRSQTNQSVVSGKLFFSFLCNGVIIASFQSWVITGKFLFSGGGGEIDFWWGWNKNLVFRRVYPTGGNFSRGMSKFLAGGATPPSPQ